MVVQEAAQLNGESPAKCDQKAMRMDGATPGDQHDLGQSSGATVEHEATQVNGESLAAEMVVQETTQLNGESPAQCDQKAMRMDGATSGDQHDLGQSSGATVEHEATQVNGESPAAKMVVE